MATGVEGEGALGGLMGAPQDVATGVEGEGALGGLMGVPQVAGGPDHVGWFVI